MTEREIVPATKERQAHLCTTLNNALFLRTIVEDRMGQKDKGVSFENIDGTRNTFEADNELLRITNGMILGAYCELVYDLVPDSTQPDGYKRVKNEDMKNAANDIITRYKEG